MDVAAFSDIGIVYLDHLGDAVLKSGFVEAVRETWPQASITIICSERTIDFWRLSPHLDRLRLASSVGSGDVLYAAASAKRLFDLVIAPRAAPDYENCHRLVAATRAPVRIGFRHPPQAPEEDYNRAFTHLVDPPDPSVEHSSVTPFRLLAALTGRPVAPRLPSLAAGASARRWASRQLPARSWLALGLGGAHPHKVWPPEAFAAVAAAFAAKDWGIVLFGSASERALADRFRARHAGAVVDLVGATDVDQLVAALERCVLFVGNDSGPKHLAAALGKPVVEVSWLSSDDPHFRHDGNFWAIGTRTIIVKPTRMFTRQETFDGAAVASVPAAAVIEAAETLLRGGVVDGPVIVQPPMPPSYQ